MMADRGTPGGPPPRPEEADEAAARTEPAGPREHTVLPTDTLAGVALRYGVSVADVRRANGLLADNGMYGRRTLSIPPPGGLAPAGPALATLAGIIVTGYGAGGGGGGERRRQAGGGGGPLSTSAAAAVSEDAPLLAATACSSGGGGASPARPPAGGRRVGSEVELTALAGTAAVAGGDARFGGAGADSLRRRRGAGGGRGSGWQQHQHPSPPGPVPASAAPSPARPTQS